MDGTEPAVTDPPHGLRVEQLDEPRGITEAAPRLSWLLPYGASRQDAYQIQAGAWDSGRISSEQSLLTRYAGPSVASAARVDWTVRVWTDLGASGWARPGWWETGLLSPADWTARWIRPADLMDPPRSAGPGVLFRGSCTMPAGLQRARLFATAYGLYELYLNGQRIGDHELTPGFTSYSSFLQVQAYDVTALLRPGRNVVGAVLTGGWLTWTRLYRDSGLRPALLAQILGWTAGGAPVTAGTGPDWHVAPAPILAADLQQGQLTDLRRQDPNWCTDPHPASQEEWQPVTVADLGYHQLVGPTAPPVRRIAELAPVAITRPSPDRLVIDFGQNLNGWVRLGGLGPEGTQISLTHGETLGPDGDVTVRHLLDSDVDPTLPFQRDQVISGGAAEEVFEPRHTTHGFRYVRVEGHPDTIDPGVTRAVVVHTDLRRTGWFACSDDRINRLHEAVVWSLRGNACEIPTDCPTRERAGWTGDWQAFLPTAAFLYDVAGFTAKWLRDLAAEQRPDGAAWHVAPNVEPAESYREFPIGAAGWGDAAVIAPWEIYRGYGDRDLLAQQWDSMTGWVEFAARAARQARHPDRLRDRPIPAAHEEFLWDSGFHWGEWLEPGGEPPENDPGAEAAYVRRLQTDDHGSLATAFLHRSAGLVAAAAGVLGRNREAARYAKLTESAAVAWRAEYLDVDGTVSPATQAGYVRALAYGLVPPVLRPAATERLVELIRTAGWHPGTGFLATGDLLPVLADSGRLDVAYRLLFQDRPPSWLAMIDRGATTIWEQWGGIDAAGVARASLNHFALGAVTTFLHRYVAGIRPVDDGPGYRRFRIAPSPGGGLSWAEGRLDCPYGRIESSWRHTGDTFMIKTVVPSGTSATLRLPDGTTHPLGPGSASFRCPLPDGAAC